jgi:hypothetical protein
MDWTVFFEEQLNSPSLRRPISTHALFLKVMIPSDHPPDASRLLGLTLFESGIGSSPVFHPNKLERNANWLILLNPQSTKLVWFDG